MLLIHRITRQACPLNVRPPTNVTNDEMIKEVKPFPYQACRFDVEWNGHFTPMRQWLKFYWMYFCLSIIGDFAWIAVSSIT